MAVPIDFCIRKIEHSVHIIGDLVAHETDNTVDQTVMAFTYQIKNFFSLKDIKTVADDRCVFIVDDIYFQVFGYTVFS